MSKKERIGIVTSNKMNKTVTVETKQRITNAKYGKITVRTKKYKAHDEENRCKTGDKVKIEETRPLSKTKFWKVSEVF